MRSYGGKRRSGAAAPRSRHAKQAKRNPADGYDPYNHELRMMSRPIEREAAAPTAAGGPYGRERDERGNQKGELKRYKGSARVGAEARQTNGSKKAGSKRAIAPRATKRVDNEDDDEDDDDKEEEEM